MKNIIPFESRDSESGEKPKNFEKLEFEKLENERIAAHSKNFNLKQEQIELSDARTNKTIKMSREADQERRNLLRDEINQIISRINLLSDLILESWLKCEELDKAYEEEVRKSKIPPKEYREAA